MVSINPAGSHTCMSKPHPLNPKAAVTSELDLQATIGQPNYSMAHSIDRLFGHV